MENNYVRLEEPTFDNEEIELAEVPTKESLKIGTLDMVMPLNGGSSGGGGFTGSWDVELPSDWDKPTTGSTDNKITQVDNRVRTLRTSTDNSFKNVKARFEMVEYNIGQLLSRVSSVETVNRTQNTNISNLTSSVNTNITNINTLFSNFNTLNSSISNSFNTLNNSINNLFRSDNYAGEYSDGDSTFTKILKGQILRLRGFLSTETDRTGNILSGLFSSDNYAGEYSNGDGIFTKVIKGQILRLRGFMSAETDRTGNALTSLFGSDDYAGEYSNGDGVFTKLIKGQILRLRGFMSAETDRNITGVANLFFSDDYSGDYSDGDSNFAKLLKGQFMRLRTHFSNLITPLSNMFSYTAGTADSFDFSLTDSTAVKFFKAQNRRMLAELRNTLDLNSNTMNLNVLNLTNAVNKLNDVWKSDDYSGIPLNNDGSAVKLFKTLFKDLRDHLTDRFANLIDSIAVLFEAYFGANPDGATGYFSKLLEDQIYRLRYTIIEEFDSINEWLSIQVDWLETLSDKFTVGNGLLDTIAGWLKLIYEKPAGEITIPPITTVPFDYDKLREILDSMEPPYLNIGDQVSSVGDTIKEAGTNFNDVLKELVKQLGDIFETGLGELGKTARVILDFLDGLLDDILHLLIPKNLDFLYNRFDSIGDKFQVKFNFIFGGVDAIKNIFGTSQAAFEDIDFSIGFIDGVSSVKLPTSKINDFAVYLKPILTGFLVLDFLISMYKWFHERGQVVE